MDETEILTGAETYQRLDATGREAFDGEWAQVLHVAAVDLDLEPLVLMVCRWWIAAGGGGTRAQATRAEFDLMRLPRAVNGLSGAPPCGRTATEIAGVLPDEQRWEFEAAWGAECRDAVGARDWNGLWSLTSAWYHTLLATEDDLARDEAFIERVDTAIADGRLDDLYVDGTLVRRT
ncbi:DUF6247 family protein [Actinorhabdospora filicis]|uniref:DUF6247 family protein n=1 Tax=Actinorhabdospora filicis TaxID=1785913 RepID=UPI0025555B2F|nr:DUF6247 family protein [Actinorhabdospora filicis]